MTDATQETMLTGQDNTETGAGTAEEVVQATDQQSAAEGEVDQSTETNDSNQGAPEEYAEFAVPEGIALDSEVLGEFMPIAKELGLNQENAQKLVDMASKLTAKMQEQQAAQWEEQIVGWAEQTRNDAELGGKNLPQTLAVARTALQQFASPEFNQLLKDSGIGNHPEMVRFAHRIGKAISNDSVVTGHSATKSEGMYAYMNKT